MLPKFHIRIRLLKQVSISLNFIIVQQTRFVAANPTSVFVKIPFMHVDYPFFVLFVSMPPIKVICNLSVLVNSCLLNYLRFII